MRAKKIENKPIVNEVVSDAIEVKRMKKQITLLEAKLKQNQNEIIKYQEMQTKLDFLRQITIQSSDGKKSSRRQTWHSVGGQSMIPLHVDSPQFKTSKNIATNEENDRISHDISESEWNEGASVSFQQNDSMSTFKVPTKVAPLKRSLLAVRTSFRSPMRRDNCM